MYIVDDTLTLPEKVKAVKLWQGIECTSFRHPIMCATCDELLYPDLNTGDILLKCRNCGKTEEVPNRIYDRYCKIKGIHRSEDFPERGFDTLSDMMEAYRREESLAERTKNILSCPVMVLWYKLKDIHIKIKYTLQRVFRGYSDNEVWDLYAHAMEYIHPRFKAFVEMDRHGYPVDMTQKEWEEILNKIDKGFDLYMKDARCELKWDDSEELDNYYQQIQEAFELFGKYFTNFWD